MWAGFPASASAHPPPARWQHRPLHPIYPTLHRPPRPLVGLAPRATHDIFHESVRVEESYVMRCHGIKALTLAPVETLNQGLPS